jgi:membrane protein implicated in regulation of membrane protease activity
MHPWFWVWLILAVVCSVAEIFTGGFFLLPFGLGAACAALLDWLGVGIGWQWTAFIGVSALLLLVLRRFAESVTHEPPQRVAGDRLIGKHGVVTTELEAHSSNGLVTVERESWRADAPGNEPLAPGTRVRVVRVEGAHLIVEPAVGDDDEDVCEEKGPQ